MRVHIGATGRIRLNRSCATAMRPFYQITLSTCFYHSKLTVICTARVETVYEMYNIDNILYFTNDFTHIKNIHSCTDVTVATVVCYNLTDLVHEIASFHVCEVTLTGRLASKTQANSTLEKNNSIAN